MVLTSKERESVRKMLEFLVKRTDVQTGGKCGFHPVHLLPIMDDLHKEGIIKKRETLHRDMYFINNSNTHKQDENRN